MAHGWASARATGRPRGTVHPTGVFENRRLTATAITDSELAGISNAATSGVIYPSPAAIARRWSQAGVLREGTDPRELFDAMAGLFLVAIQRDALSVEAGDRAVAVLVEALVDRWSPRP